MNARRDTVALGSRVDRKLKEKVDVLLGDPWRAGKVKHGAMSAYLNKLIAEDLLRREALAEQVCKEFCDDFRYVTGE